MPILKHNIRGERERRGSTHGMPNAYLAQEGRGGELFGPVVGLNCTSGGV